MLSALASLIWGTEEETPNIEVNAAGGNPSNEDHVELDNDWIFIRPKRKYKFGRYFNKAL